MHKHKLYKNFRFSLWQNKQCVNDKSHRKRYRKPLFYISWPIGNSFSFIWHKNYNQKGWLYDGLIKLSIVTRSERSFIFSYRDVSISYIFYFLFISFDKIKKIQFLHYIYLPSLFWGKKKIQKKKHRFRFINNSNK